MNIEQGDIWLINFDPSVGGEIQKQRPAAVINDDRLGRFGLRIVIPITEWKTFFSDYPWIIKIEGSAENGLRKTSGIECFQVKSFSEKRFVKKLGAISATQVAEIHLTVLKTFNPKYAIK